MRRIKEGLASKENINNSEKFMNYSHHSIFIGFSLSYLFKKIFSKYLIYSYNRGCHKAEHSSETSISSFRYSSFFSKFLEFIEGWVESDINNEFFRKEKSLYIFCFSDEMDIGNILNSSDRFKDFLIEGGCYSYGLFGYTEDFTRKKSTSFPSFLWEPDFKNTSSKCIKHSLFRGKEKEEMGWEVGERIYESEEFREENIDESFNSIFQRCYFFCDSFSFSCKDSKFRERGFLLEESFCMNSQEFSNDRRSSFISFSFSQRDSGEIRDDEGIKEHTMEVMGAKEREEIYVIRARGFYSDEGLRRRKAFRFNRVDERFKAFTAHRKLRREKYFSLSISQGSIKKVFRDIDTTEKREYDETSFLRFYEAGEASQSIFHSDKGSKARVKWSSLASLLLLYQAYKFININYS